MWGFPPSGQSAGEGGLTLTGDLRNAERCGFIRLGRRHMHVMLSAKENKFGMLALENLVLWPRTFTFQTAPSDPVRSTSGFPSAKIIALELCPRQELYLPP